MPSILIVDDEANIVASLERALAREGHQVEGAASAAEARARLAEARDVVLLDVRLPDGDGLALLEEIMTSAPETVVRPLIDPTLVRELSLVTVAGRPHCHPIARLLCALRASKWDNDEAPDLGRCGQNAPMQLLSATC